VDGANTDDARARLAARYRQALRTDLPPSVTSADPGAPRPLSWAQRRIWFIGQLDGTSSALNVHLVRRIRGALDVDTLRAAVTEVFRRHDALRTVFGEENGEPWQRPGPWAAPPFQLVDLTGREPGDRAAHARSILADEVARPYRLGAEPPVRAALVRLDADEHILAVTVHHIAVDDASVAVLARDLGELYRARVQQRVPVLPVLGFGYLDFAAWQRDRTDPDPAGDRGYWREQLADLPSPSGLPPDRLRPAGGSFAGATVSCTVHPGVTAALRALGAAEQATLFMTLHAALVVLLHRHSGAEDVVVGTPVADRQLPGLDDHVGCFLNLLALRSRVAGGVGFREVLRRSRAVCVAAFDHRGLPFEQVVEAVGAPRTASVHPLFQTMLVLQGSGDLTLDLPGLTDEQVPVPTGHSQLDLTLSVVDLGDTLRCHLEFNTDLFDRERMERFARQWQVLLAEVVRAPDRPVMELAVLPADELELLRAWGDGGPALGGDSGGLHRLVEEQVRRTADATAVRFGGAALSYADLDARAGRLASHLIGLGVQRGDVVGVLLERGVRTCPSRCTPSSRRVRPSFRSTPASRSRARHRCSPRPGQPRWSPTNGSPQAFPASVRWYCSAPSARQSTRSRRSISPSPPTRTTRPTCCTRRAPRDGRRERSTPTVASSTGCGGCSGT